MLLVRIVWPPGQRFFHAKPIVQKELLVFFFARSVNWPMRPRLTVRVEVTRRVYFFRKKPCLQEKFFTFRRYGGIFDGVTAPVVNWMQDPFARGAYSYATPQSHAAIRQLSQPINGKVFLSGEALYQGEETGTVEAALASGLETAQKVLRSCAR